MRVLVVSDIHGRLLRAKRLLEIVKEYNPEKILFLGDYLYNGPRNGVPEDYDPLQVSFLLNTLAPLVIGVRGNCDSRVDDLLLSFPLKDNVYADLNGFHLDLFHGDEFSLQNLEKKPGDILMSGHTHIYVLKKENGFIHLNPGSISFPKNGNPPTYAVFEENFIEIRGFDDNKPLAHLALRA
jgi:putative phosphoesterase